MTFLEWEIYYRYELEEAVLRAEGLLKTATGLLPVEELAALRTVVEVAAHVAERGRLCEETNTWKID